MTPCRPAALALLLAAAPAAAGVGFTPATPGHAWRWPRDHFAHPGYRTEWWYFTGRLQAVDDPARSFGYQLTFFRIGILPARPDLASPWAAADVSMAHAALGDLAAGQHRFAEVLWREAPLLAAFPPPPAAGAAAGPIAWAQAPPGTPGRWTLDLDRGAFAYAVEDRARGLAFRLTARPTRPVVLQGPGGLSRKSAREGYASLYYSLTRLETEGTVTAGDRTWRVRGVSWLDREWGSSQLAPAQVGWDWFALRLADGRDLMLYLLRRADGAVDWASGTLVGADGRVRWLSGAEVAVRPTATWESPHTGARYPAAWEVEVPSAAIALQVAPALADQENRSTLSGGVFYWEGAVDLRDPAGRPAGEGYVELTGYGEKSRPPI